MIDPFLSSVKVEELKKRLLFLFFALAVFVFGTHLSVPGVNLPVWQHLLSQGAIFSFIGLITGGALQNFAVVAMGITPYINASIMMQLLTVISPKLEELQKEGGEMGRKQIAMYTRILTVVLSLFEASMMTFPLRSYGVFVDPSLWHLIGIVLTLTAGSAFLLWLGELITDKGIGNGVSILIFAGIILRYPTYTAEVFRITAANLHDEGPMVLLRLLGFLVVGIALIVLIVAFTLGIRKVPIQQAKRIVGRRIMGGQSTYLPIKVDNGGVIAIIFAISVLYFPVTVLNFFHQYAQNAFVGFIQNLFSPYSIFFNVFYAVLVVFFTYFYSQIVFNVEDIAENLKKTGSFIPGIRPGKPTAEALSKILSRITFIAAIFLVIVAVVPGWLTQVFHVAFYLGSTSLLIIVGVILDTIQQIQARLIMRQYRGFLK
jgi:preprotein translocase subunit SecY